MNRIQRLNALHVLVVGLLFWCVGFISTSTSTILLSGTSCYYWRGGIVNNSTKDDATIRSITNALNYSTRTHQYGTAQSEESNESFIIKAAKHDDLFVPGTLTNMSRVESYRRCYADPVRYQHHFRGVSSRCSISETHGLIYYQIAKAGSTTCRHIMKTSLEGKEQACRLDLAHVSTSNSDSNRDKKSNLHFTFFREPTSRFFSAYQEAFRRNRKYAANIPVRYQSFLLPFSNISGKEFRAIVKVKTTENKQRLTKAFQQFVQDYDAQEPFDGHLRLQIPRLVNPNTGRTTNVPLDAAYDVSHMEASFQDIGKRINLTNTSIQVIHAYDRGNKRMDLSDIGNETRRKICQLSAIDFCCLNYPLPPECKDSIQCRWVDKPELSKELLIEPVSPYPP